MTTLLFWILVVIVAVPLGKVLCHPEKVYEYPQLIAAAFVIFILPQAVSLVRFPGAAPDGAVRRVLGVACLCMLASMVGYTWPDDFQKSWRAPLNLDFRRLLHIGLLFVACGIGFSYALGTTEPETTEFGGWTGRATILGFFQQLSYPGFAICLLVCVRKPTAVSIASVLVGAIVPVQSIVFGRREPAAAFALIIGLSLYFQFRIRPARWVVFSVIVVGMMAIPATATYRQFHMENDWQNIRQINLLENFREYLNEESVLELRNAAMLIEATRRSGAYEWGAGYWNHLVFRYVPAQILGQEFKQGLKLNTRVELVERELAVRVFQPSGLHCDVPGGFVPTARLLWMCVLRSAGCCFQETLEFGSVGGSNRAAIALHADLSFGAARGDALDVGFPSRLSLQRSISRRSSLVCAPTGILARGDVRKR